MASKKRDYKAEYARRNAKATSAGTSYGKLRRLSPDVRERFYKADESVRSAMVASDPATYVPKRRKSVTVKNPRKITEFADGEHVDTYTADFVPFLLQARAQGRGPISLAVTIKGRRVFISQARTDISNMPSEEAGGGRGSSGRGRVQVTGLELWTKDASGFDPEELLALVRFYGNAPDALYSLWELNDSPTMRTRRR